MGNNINVTSIQIFHEVITKITLFPDWAILFLQSWLVNLYNNTKVKLLQLNCFGNYEIFYLREEFKKKKKIQKSDIVQKGRVGRSPKTYF